MMVFCMFSLESPHRDDSNEYTYYTIFNIKKKLTLSYLKSAAMGFFLGTQKMSSKQETGYRYLLPIDFSCVCWSLTYLIVISEQPVL